MSAYFADDVKNNIIYAANTRYKKNKFNIKFFFSLKQKKRIATLSWKQNSM